MNLFGLKAELLKPPRGASPHWMGGVLLAWGLLIPATAAQEVVSLTPPPKRGAPGPVPAVVQPARPIKVRELRPPPNRQPSSGQTRLLSNRRGWPTLAPVAVTTRAPTNAPSYQEELDLPTSVGEQGFLVPEPIIVDDTVRGIRSEPVDLAAPPSGSRNFPYSTHQSKPRPIEMPSPTVAGPAMQKTQGPQLVGSVPPPNPVCLYPQVPPTQTVKANVQQDGNCMLAPYRQRATNTQAVTLLDSMGEGIPTNFNAWWAAQLSRPIFQNAGAGPPKSMPVSLEALLHAALVHSPHIQVAATEPHILHTQVFVEAAEFDWRDFLETKYNDTNDPIGNTLVAGPDAERFIEQEWYGIGGVRRRNRLGGEVEITQRLGHLTSNSIFLIPPNQGSSRLQLNYRQPLMQGRGRSYNESLILLAKIDFNSAGDEFLTTVQAHLVKVTEVYWELVRSRAEYLQKQKALQAAERVLVNLEGRRELDVLDRQVLRARAAVETRRAEIARARTSIRNAESQLRLLVNDPTWNYASGLELLPADLPPQWGLDVELADALSTALTFRPDISKAIRELRAANIQLGVAKNQVLPQLDVLLGTYIAGLDGNSDVFNSWVNQFRDGQPGFNVGLEFELPRGNRAAKAAERRRKWELSRAHHQFRAVVESSLTEVEIAVREIETAHMELVGRYHSMQAAAKENRYLYDRWKTLPGVNDSATLLLEDFLESQLRLALEEAAFAQAQADYVIASVKLKQTMGTLMHVMPNQMAASP